MIAKVLLASIAAAGLFLAQPQSASAGVDVDVEVEVDVGVAHYPGQYDYPDYPRYPAHHGYDDDDDYDYDRVSCPEGRRMVWRAGYRKVRTIICDGQFYRYSGWKRGHLWRVSVDSDSGRIIRARKIRSYH